MAAKLIASLEEEPESDDIVLAYTAPFSDAVSYYRGAVATFLESFAEHRDELRKEDIFFVMPAGLDENYRAPGISIEVLFADFAERCARAFHKNVARRLVFLLRAEEPRDEAGFVSSSRLLASLSAADRTKFIAFTVPPGAAGPQVAAPQRLNVVEPPTSRDLDVVLREFVSSVARRVLVVRTPSMRGPMVERQIEEFSMALGQPLFRLNLRRGTPSGVVEGALQDLQAQAIGRGHFGNYPDLTLEPMDRLAALCEALARQISEDRGELLLLLSAFELAQEDPSVFVALVQALSVAACSPRVRYIVLDSAGVLPVLEEAPRYIEELNVQVDSTAIESGLLAKLQLPELPVRERVDCLQGLALIASARQQHETSLSLHDQALGLAEPLGDPSVSFKVWLAIGHTLYRAQSWEPAERAYGKSLDIALTASLGASVAESTMHLGNALLCGGKPGEAATCYDSAAAWYDKLGVPLLTFNAKTWLGEALARSGDLRAAQQIWDATLDGYQRLGSDFRDMTLEGKKQVLARLVRLHERTRNVEQATKRQAELGALGSAPVVTEQP